ncbi:MAG: hypothetical protein WB609_08780 [Candidatus Cybelea sp.]
MLLYVPDETLVRVYSYPRGKLVGTLKQNMWSDGLCTNPVNGDVYLVEVFSIVVYAHGGKYPMMTLDYPGSGANSCAIDPRSGNLAVTDSGTPAEVYVYPNASGTPKPYSGFPGMHAAADCVYDDRGTLYVTGDDLSVAFRLDEIAKSGTLVTIRLGATKTSLDPFAGVQWDGKHVILSDGGQNLYQFKISRHRGLLAGQAVLDESTNVYGMWLQGDRLLVPNDDQGGHVRIYDYPAGGKPIKTLTGFQLPYGAAVSVPRS